MQEDLLTLQLRYADAVFQAAKQQQRAELLLAQLTAIAVQDARNEIQPDRTPTRASRTPDLLRNTERARIERGIVADVARKLGLSHEHVRMVASGKRNSPAVEEVLNAELIERRKNQGLESAERVA